MGWFLRSRAVYFIYFPGNQAKYFVSGLFVIAGQCYSEDRVFTRILRLVSAWIPPPIMCTARILGLHQVLYRHFIRFVLRSDVLLNPELGRSAIRAERHIGMPSKQSTPYTCVHVSGT